MPSETRALVRPMRASDYSAVRRLVYQLSSGRAEFELAQIAAFLSLPTFHPFVVEMDGVIVAYAELHRLPHLARGWEGRIERVVVDEDQRGRGFGELLCRHLVEQARQLGCVRIELRVENESAQALYAKLGFHAVESTVMILADLQGSG